jgi:ribosomal protein L11 methyltransferase
MSFQGIDIPPFWRVLPAEIDPSTRGPLGNLTLIRIRAGHGFGIGTHETTQLCLLGLGHLLRTDPKPATVLDFGAGSGILAVAAALCGARVEAIEIDERAIENARENAALNGVESQIELRTHLSEPAPSFDLVLANILNQVLLAHAEQLCARQSRKGQMILSGLFGTDVPGILARYKPLLAPMTAEIYERGDWRAIAFARPREAG